MERTVRAGFRTKLSGGTLAPAVQNAYFRLNCIIRGSRAASRMPKLELASVAGRILEIAVIEQVEKLRPRRHAMILRPPGKTG